jgi:putative Mg2+ transporter-C (MgtC) family protein
MAVIEYEWILRLVCATIVGGIIGLERHTRSKDAGIRTHAIVALAAAMLMLVSKYGFSGEEADRARIAAQVVSGVGFLGAGIIFVRNDLILGLTTAAGIWATSAIGLCFGVGFYQIGAIGGIMIIAIQRIVFHFFNYSTAKTMMNIRLLMNHDGKLKDISDLFHKMGYVQSDNSITPADSKEHWYLTTGITGAKDMDPSELINELEKLNGVEEVTLV